MEKLKITNDLVGMEFDPVEVEWTSKDTMLYALGVGAKPENELDYSYVGVVEDCLLHGESVGLFQEPEGIVNVLGAAESHKRVGKELFHRGLKTGHL